MIQNPKTYRIFYGWFIVAACFLITGLTGGIIALGFTAFFQPIVDEFGWNYATVSLAASFRGVEAGLLAPFIGIVIDRWGPRRLALGGIIVTGLSMLLLSTINTLLAFYVAFGIIAVGVSGCSPTVVMTAVNNWFRKRIGLAIGLMTSGFACGGLLVPLVVKLIDVYQWRMALVILAGMVLVIGIPAALVLRHKPEQYGYLPDGEASFEAAIDQAAVKVEPPSADFTTRQALAGRLFWHLGLALLIQFLVVSTVVVHVMPYLENAGISRGTASLVAMALPVISIVGRIGSGWFADRFNKKKTATALFASMAAGMFCWSFVTGATAWLIAPYLILVGVGWGGNAIIRVSITSEAFGRRRFGSILGLMMGLSAIGGIAGPFIGGWVFDMWGSYQYVWWLYTGLLVVAMVIIATLPSRQQHFAAR
jgi:sugar phosphate permease